MTASAKKTKAIAKTAKGKQKSIAAPVKKLPRARKTARVETVGQAETFAAVTSVANDEVLMQEPEAAAMVEVMPVEVVPQARTGETDDRILLPARMELASLDEAHQLLQSKYPPLSNKYILDGGLLSVIDSAGVQMLVSFIRSMTAKGCKVEWDNYSVQVYQLASELGVTSQLGD
jgi:ABC-type transporter Mla MlaB component